MNGLEEIQKIIKNFVSESKQAKEQITEIESKRTQLAQERNEKKNANISKYEAEVSVLGKQISELGNQSQGLQNKLDMKFNEVKKLVYLTIDNLIAEEIRKVRKIDEERQELEDKILLQKEREAKYEMQKQEFYERFGRMPELSENAKKEDEVQDRQCLTYKARIEEVKELIKNEEVSLAEIAKIKRDFKNGNWSNILESEEVEEEVAVLPLINEEIKIEETEPVQEIKLEEFEPIEKIKIEEVAPIEEIKVEKFEPIEEIQVEEFEPAEEIQVEEFEPLEEMHVEELEPTEEIHIEELEVEPFNIVEESGQKELVEEVPETLIERIETTDEQEQKQIDEIEELARAIVEEIVAEQTKKLNIDKVEEQQEERVPVQKIEEQQEESVPVQIIEEQQESEPVSKVEEQEIITFEEKEEKQVKVSAVEENITLSNIIAKIEDGEVVYKAQISNGEEIKVYPANLAIGNALLNDEEFREEIKEVLINYAVAEYKLLDKKVIKKIDPTVCEVLNRFAQKYNYDVRNLIYNYAMSFSKKEEAETDTIPIIYNFSYIGGTNLSKKEKVTISKICKNAVKNARIDVIGSVTGLGKIKYMLKRIFAANNANALPEGKY